jgi:hypothetical protein
MKRLTLSLLAVIWGGFASAQVFDKQIIFENGPQEQHINLVFLPDGYLAGDMTKFVTDVNGIVNKIFDQSPFKEYKPYFNAYAILVPSNQSGARHPQTSPDSDCDPVPQVNSVDNYFGSTFDFGNIHRLLVPLNASKIGSVLADNYPLYDQAFVLVNSPHYGGSGGSVATASNNNSSSEVAIHEIGHSFAFLSDEYWAGPQYAHEAPNMTQQSNASLVKWKNWVGSGDIGVFPYNEDPSWFRPHQNCKMRFLNVPFCAVCRETFVERIHNLVDPVISYLPEDTEFNIQEGVIDFSVDLITPVPNTFKIRWIRNGQELSVSKDEPELTLSVNSLVTGTNTIQVQIVDTTALTRSNTHFQSHVYEIMWTIDTDNVTGIEVQSIRSEYEIEIYPNPVAEALTISYTLPRNAAVEIELVNADGRRVKTLANERQRPGTYTYELPSNELNMNTSGLYYLRLSVDGATLVEKLIRK